MYPISIVILILYYYPINFCTFVTFNFFINCCTDIMYLYLTCSISYGVNLYLDLQNINKFKFKYSEIERFQDKKLMKFLPSNKKYGTHGLVIVF
jgi:hypothetical protein